MRAGIGLALLTRDRAQHEHWQLARAAEAEGEALSQAAADVEGRAPHVQQSCRAGAWMSTGGGDGPDSWQVHLPAMGMSGDDEVEFVRARVIHQVGRVCDGEAEGSVRDLLQRGRQVIVPTVRIVDAYQPQRAAAPLHGC
jgi:hypothetical protein